MRKLHAWIVAASVILSPNGEASARSRQTTVQYGNASWYGRWHEGRLTASGKPFHALRDSAASRTLPLGTWVRVTNLSNDRSVVVEITDRGPYVSGRILDVSLLTARKLGMVVVGVTRVKIETIPKEE